MTNKWFHTSRGKTSEVAICLETRTVKKQFRGFDDPRRDAVAVKGRGSLRQSYLRELECLRRLAGQDNFPQLVDHDDEQLWIMMSYCGEPYPCLWPRRPRPDLIDQSIKIVDTLARLDIKYNYKEFFTHEGKRYPHLQAGNVTLWGDRLFLIDFEISLPVGIEHQLDSQFVDRFKYGYTTEEFKRLFREFLVPTAHPANHLCFNRYGNKMHIKRKKRKP